MKNFLFFLSCTLLVAGCSKNDDEQGPNPNAIIEFEDLFTHDICVGHWDTNGDGELSYGEAASVKSLDDVFCGTEIVHFNELEYFTGLTTIEGDAFYACTRLTNVIIPKSVTSLEEFAFCDCTRLTRITIPNSVTSIGTEAISGCVSLTSIIIPQSVTFIGERAFMDCIRLTNVVIPQSVTSIGDGAFSHCNSLSSITIPKSVTSIGDDAFYGCSSLSSITIPDNVTSIGECVFRDCSSLTSIYCKPTTPPLLGSFVFEKTPSVMKIYVPRVSADAYKNALVWNEYASQIVGYDF